MRRNPPSATSTLPHYVLALDPIKGSKYNAANNIFYSSSLQYLQYLSLSIVYTYFKNGGVPFSAMNGLFFFLSLSTTKMNLATSGIVGWDALYAAILISYNGAKVFSYKSMTFIIEFTCCFYSGRRGRTVSKY